MQTEEAEDQACLCFIVFASLHWVEQSATSGRRHARGAAVMLCPMQKLLLASGGTRHPKTHQRMPPPVW